MPLRRSPHPLLLGLAVAVAAVLAACGTTAEDTAPTTTEVAAAAGSGFCLTWGRFQESLSDWVLDTPASLGAAATTAARSLRAAEEARDQAPEDLQDPLDAVVETATAVESTVVASDSLDDAFAGVVGLFGGTEISSAIAAVTDWVAVGC